MTAERPSLTGSNGELLLGVLPLSDAFSELWGALAAEVGAEALLLSEPAECAALRTPHILLVACGGSEMAATDAVAGLRRSSQSALAVIGATPDHRVAIEIIHSGATEYFALPYDLARLRAWLVGETSKAAKPGYPGDSCPGVRYDFSAIVGRSRNLLAAVGTAAKVIPHGDTTVLVLGETGTGKELLAQAIHDNGPRSTGSFVAINCAALPRSLVEAELFGYKAGAFTDARASKPGLIESAHGGTLFLDEIGELSFDAQAKLLRALEQRTIRRLGSVADIEVDTRVIAATCVDLAQAVAEGRFRDDLFYRLNVVTIRIPALRERGDDVLLLADHFLRTCAAHHRIKVPRLRASTRKALLAHRWPGNVRELRNFMQRVVLLGEDALVSTLSGKDGFGHERPGSLPFPAPLDVIDRAAARLMVERVGGNKSAAAAALGISRKRLYALLRTGSARY